MPSKRIMVSLSSGSRFWAPPCESPEAVVDIALETAKKHSLIDADAWAGRFIAEDRWGVRTHIVIDVDHTDYDPDTAHLPGRNNLPVVIVSLSGSGEYAQTASRLLEDKVNQEVRQIHGSHAVGVQPPFLLDHTGDKIPTFPNPRTAQKVPSSE